MDYGFMPSHGAPVDIPDDFKATAGEPLAEGTPVASEEYVIEAMRTVYDPEIPVNIYDLGLILKLDISQIGEVNVDITLTAPGCPVAGELPGWVADAIAKVDGVGEVIVALVWDPPWSPDLMSEDAKLALGMF
jgi:FeS assembly SUF system protein